VLLTTAFVVMATAAGFLLWMLAREGGAPKGNPSLEELEAETRVVEWPAVVPVTERERIQALVDASTDPNLRTARFQAEQDVLDEHENAIPALLNAMHRLVTGSTPERSLESRGPRNQFLVLDRLLTRLRLEVSPTDRPSRVTRAGDAKWLQRRARTWFAWWDRVSPNLWD
jgi:hypothetical protein